MNNKITKIVFIAFLVRLLLMIIDNFWFYLPNSGGDTAMFDIQAYNMISNNPYSFSEIIASGAKFHVWLGSILYSVFGRVPLLWAFINVILGSASVFYIHRVVFLITNSYKYANRSAWIAAFFPNFAVLSATILREAPIYFFLSLSLLYFVKYIKYKSTLNLIKFFVFGILASVFHSAMFALFLGFILYSVVLNKKTSVLVKISILLLSIVVLYFINTTGIGLSKFGGSFEGAIEGLTEGGSVSALGRTNYPDWLLLSGSISSLLLSPIRIIAFLFAPFIPFFAKSGAHLLGVFDGFLYFVIIWRIFKARRILLKNEMSKGLITIAITLTIGFSFGASNWGTNIRHRSKIVPVILMIPLLNKKDRKKTLLLNDNYN